MPLDMNKLKKIQGRFTEMRNELAQGGEWKPDAGSYELRFMEIKDAPMGLFYEYNTHNYPGDKQGFEYCGRAIGEDCILCDVIENNSDSDDATFLRFLEELSPPKNGRVAFLVCIKPQNGEWMGPFVWKARMDQSVKFQPLFSGKWGDPTTRNFEVTFTARKKTFKGYKILDVDSVLPTHDGVSPCPIPESKLKTIDVIRRLHPRGYQEIWDKLMDTAVGPYLRDMPAPPETQEEDQPQEAAQEYQETPVEGQDTAGQEYAAEAAEEQEAAPEPPPPPPAPVKTVTKRPTASLPSTPPRPVPVQAPAPAPAPVPAQAPRPPAQAPTTVKAAPAPVAGGGSVVDRAKAVLAAKKAGG